MSPAPPFFMLAFIVKVASATVTNDVQAAMLASVESPARSMTAPFLTSSSSVPTSLCTKAFETEQRPPSSATSLKIRFAVLPNGSPRSPKYMGPLKTTSASSATRTVVSVSLLTMVCEWSGTLNVDMNS